MRFQHLWVAGLVILTLAWRAAAQEPIVIAHRGGAALRPENTLAAFRHAISQNVSVLEFDMNLTADGEIILHHDSTVNAAICKADPGSAVVAGPIRGLTLAQLRSFECGSFVRPTSSQYEVAPGARMITLDEFLEAVKGSAVRLLGETKMPAGEGVPPAMFVQRIDAAIRKHGVARRFILQSSDYRTTDAMRKLNPEVQICLLNARRFKPNYLTVARKHGATHLMLRAEDVTPAQVKELKAAGLVLFSGTANRLEEWAKYESLEFDGILTDDPVGLAQFLRSVSR
jgi:glycerophosphoryl diester phosphodiesterase